MTRNQALERYDVRKDGVITSLGKFEGEMIYVPVFWDYCLQGMFDEDIAGVFFVPFDNDDRLEFPEIGQAYGIAMEESDQGFVNTREFATMAEYQAAIAKLEQEESEQVQEEF